MYVYIYIYIYMIEKEIDRHVLSVRCQAWWSSARRPRSPAGDAGGHGSACTRKWIDR